jgi:hypothetical protein
MFKGEYKYISSTGKKYGYKKGDVVTFQGKVYECLNFTEMTPIQDLNNWKYVGIDKNFISENPPVSPQKGQIWISGAGRSYVWFEDENSSQWIET